MGTVLLSISAGACSPHVPEPQQPIYPAGTVPAPTVKAHFHPDPYDESFQPLPLIAHPGDYIFLPISVVPPAPNSISVAAAGPGEVRPIVPAAATLTEAEMTAVLRDAGWPEELIGQALGVSRCESATWSPTLGEFLWRPAITGDNGVSVGLFQIGRGRPGWQGWFHYFGMDEEPWADPVYNARVAWLVYSYDISRGNPPWTQWTCKPDRGS